MRNSSVPLLEEEQGEIAAILKTLSLESPQF